MRHPLIVPLLLAFGIAPAVAPQAQTPGPPAGEAAPAPAPPTQAGGPYIPPLALRGAPGGRIGGASRSASVPSEPLPVIALLAPASHTGLSATPEPTLYFFVSRAVRWPTEFTISAPLQPAPVLEVTIASPRSAGIYGLPLARYGVRLQPGIVYTWSVSAVLDPHAWSHNIVASATIMLDRSATAPPSRRAVDLARSGLWYDAVAAAVAQESRDRHAMLDALMRQVGLTTAAAADQPALTE